MNKKSFFHGWQPINIFDWMDNMANHPTKTIKLCQQMEKDLEQMQLEIRRLQIEIEELKYDKTT